MQMLTLLQGLIHKLESGGGARFVKLLVFVLGCASLLITYDVRCARNMNAPSAMDAAQLARNISQGRGYTTDCIRPLSIYLIKKKHLDATDRDPARLNRNHPDISNPPVYPIVLAGLMKVLPFHYETKLKGWYWSRPDPAAAGERRGIRYQPDFLITFFNQFLFFVVVALSFFWAKRLFDFPVARTSSILLLLSDVLWRFSSSGLSTMLLLLIFMGLVWCLTLWESETREPKWGQRGASLLSVAAGLLVGIGALTRYSFVCMIIPVLLFLAIFGGPRRILYCIAALAAVAVVVSPWIARNYAVSGTAFGTASYNVIEWFSPGFRLQRSLQPDIPQFWLGLYLKKLRDNLSPILQGDFINMSGGWITGFFLVSVLVGFRNLGLRRLRYFAVGSMVVLAIVQAIAKTHLSDETPEFNSENLLVLVSPLVTVFGVALFYSLLDGINFPVFELRYAAVTLFVLLVKLPFQFTMISGSYPVAYPPYSPNMIETSAHILKQNELMMTDIPWAVAWYGDREAVWLTLNATASPDNPTDWQESFFAINDVLKPIHALYLTPRSLDARFQTDWVRANQVSWGRFIMGTLGGGQVPGSFPLTKIPPGYLPEQLLLSDLARW
jgi:dolichyl-phosphate-mannose-protein mannosyltransferase